MKDEIAPGAYVAVLMAALLGLFALVWIYTATQRVRFLPRQSGTWLAHVQMIERCDVGDVAILGSSRANAGFVPRLLGVNAVNLAMSGGTPMEAYYEARAIFRCPRPPKIVVLSFSGYDLEHTTWFWERSARFGLLDYDDLQDIARHAASLHYPDLYHGSFGSEPPPWMKNGLYATHFPPYDFASLLAARAGRWRRKENAAFAAETFASRGQHLIDSGKCTNAPTWEAQQTSFEASPLLGFYLDRLIALLRSHGVEVIHMSTPLSALNYKGLRGNYPRDFQSFLEQTADRNPGFKLVGPTFSSLGLCDFSDPDHLNQGGAEKFSRSIAPLIAAELAGHNGAASPARRQLLPN